MLVHVSELGADSDDFGMYDPKRRVIKINRDMALSAQWQALWHEWTHMVLFDTGLHGVLSSELEEVFCEVFGQMRAFEMIYR